MSTYCIPCERWYKCTHNEVDCELGKPEENSSMFMSGDEWTCPGCENKIITGFGKPRMMSHGAHVVYSKRACPMCLDSKVNTYGEPCEVCVEEES